MTLMTETIEVQGFHCSGCADNLGRALQSLEGVIKADAHYQQGRVEVRFDSDRVTDEDIRDRIRAAGFAPRDDQ